MLCQLGPDGRGFPYCKTISYFIAKESCVDSDLVTEISEKEKHRFTNFPQKCESFNRFKKNFLANSVGTQPFLHSFQGVLS